MRAECELVQVLFGTYSSLVSVQRLYKDNGYICTVLNRLQTAVTCSNSGILKSQSTSGAPGLQSFGTDPLASHTAWGQKATCGGLCSEKQASKARPLVNCCREPTSTKAVGERGREEEGSWEFSVGQSAGLRAATVSVAHTRRRVSSGPHVCG